MTSGYAAFSTNISLHAKANIKKIPAATTLRQNCDTTSGDGLYADINEDGKCIYKGKNPSNYITFNNELWRIISIESNNTIKIIRNESIGEMPFDSIGLRDYYSNGIGGTYCALPRFQSGCHAWAITDNFFINISAASGSVLKDAELNNYLNTSYYNSFNEKDKKKIIEGTFYYGGLMDRNVNYSISTTLTNIKRHLWNGKIGLIDMSDYLLANSSSNCNTIKNACNNSNCRNTNWLDTNYDFWTITPAGTIWVDSSGENSTLFSILASPKIPCSSFEKPASSINVRPVIYLSSDITLSGSGSEKNPYIITN